MSSDPPKVFLSYSHKDERLKERLATHLGVLRDRLAVWDDRQLRAGEDWYAGIAKAIESANVAVLLISADFLNSDFILKEEVPRLLRRREEEGMTIVPVLLKACAWDEIQWLAAMQIRPTDAKPVTALQGNRREEALTVMAKEIVELAEDRSPRYADTPSRELAEALEEAFLRHEDLMSAGGDTGASLETILDLKRRMREEGQLKPGDYLAEGRFRLLDVLGRGGFSTVFRAYDRREQGLVAVKVLHTQYSQDRSRRERFFRGARQMDKLQHQGIVRVIKARSTACS